MKQPVVRSKPKPLVTAPIPQGSVPAPFNSMHAAAIQAVAAGNANDGQQKMAIDWILKGACALNDWPYRDSERETCIGLGRHFVGQQIVGLMRVNISALRKREQKEENQNAI